MRFVISTVSIFLVCISAIAQPSMLQTGSLEQIESSVLDETRSLYVHLPNGYATSEDRFPVLYVLDAESNFRKVVGIVDHLSASGRIPSMIIIGVPNTFRSGRPSRFTDLAPSQLESPAQDGASKFLQFLSVELIPHIDETYRTEPHRTLLGHSLGGLFSIYALIQQPSAFSAFIAISPSLGRNNQQEVRRAATFFEQQSSFKKNLQLSLGNEGGNTQLGTEALVAVMTNQAPDDFEWRFSHMKEEDHISVYHQSTYEALESIFDGWLIPEAYLSDYDVSVVERHYVSLSNRLGYEVAVPEPYYRQLGYRILVEQDFEYSKWTFERYIEAYPTSANAWVGLGDVQLMEGALKTAESSYSKALALDPEHERAIQMSKALESR